jgi:copper homeostasis protein
MNYKLEICTDSAESAINSQKAGADRVELCDNLTEGGTTPGYGTLAVVRENLNIKLHVLIRTRGGDFLYDDMEYDIMKRDIVICRNLKVDGVVIGILKSDGTIDVKRSARLVELAFPMSVTFHRAFDMCSDPYIGLEDVITTGAQRLLTSGQKDQAPQGAVLIKDLINQAGRRITVMPGSGLDEYNIEKFAEFTRASEFHLTGRKVVDSGMIFRREKVTMGGFPDIPEFSRKVADPERIKKIINILKGI